MAEVSRKTGGKEDEQEGVKVGREVCRKARMGREVRKLGSQEVREEDRKRQAVVGPDGITLK